MLRRASVADVKAGRVAGGSSHIVVVMLHYPRFLAADLRDEYVRALAPPAELFEEFKALERATGDHDRAFAEVDYERRFWLAKPGLAELERLAAKARAGIDVVLVCQCTADQKCHADLLLLMARRFHGAETGETTAMAAPGAYAAFRARVDAWAADF
jgi:hypothetical protein